MRATALTLLLVSTPTLADVRAVGIRRAVHLLGDSTPEEMDAAVTAALELEGEVPGLDAPLILAIAWAESRFDARARPLCGVMQVSPRDMGVPRVLRQATCRSWRSDIRTGMGAGVREIAKILAEIPRVRGDLSRALEYRACGSKAFTRRCRKHRWVRRVEALAAELREPSFHMEERHAVRIQEK